jgi:phosphatidylglycerol:prolipoprotein diacylglycerol transferase
MIALPYVSVPTLPVTLPVVGEITLTIFGLCVAAGVVLGLRLAESYARAHGLSDKDTRPVLLPVLVGGLVGAHWVSVLAYYPERVLEKPWILLDFTSGLASTGGFVGGLAVFGFVAWRRKLPWPRLADTVVFGLAHGFTIGRIGCSLVHDHPGIVVTADTFGAVGPWPCPCPSTGGTAVGCCTDPIFRYDLGLTELMLLLVLATGVWVFLRRRRPGVLAASVALGYAILRFPLDFLRAEDLRHGPLTFAQWVCIAMSLTGIVALLRLRRTPV